jgi:hypothetical protein
MEWAFAFYSSCPTIWRPCRQPSRWVAGLPFLYTPKIQAYSTFEMTRLCSMIAWNGLIFRDGVAIAWAGTVKRFLSFPGRTVPLVAIKRPWLIAEVIKEFPYS